MCCRWWPLRLEMRRERTRGGVNLGCAGRDLDGRTFAGWYYDAEYTERWDFEADKVEDNMTLYAKWI